MYMTQSYSLLIDEQRLHLEHRTQLYFIPFFISLFFFIFLIHDVEHMSALTKSDVQCNEHLFQELTTQE